jgi:transcription termination/antitermination protein NusG
VAAALAADLAGSGHDLCMIVRFLMDEREVDKQPEEEPRETPAEPTEEQQAPQADSPRDESADQARAEEAAEPESTAGPESPRSEQEAAPVEQPEELSHEERVDLMGEAPPSEIPGLLASEAAEEAAEQPAEEAEAEPEVERPLSRSSAERRAGQLAGGEVPQGVSSEPAWYVIHCYSGYENKVRHNLEQRIETMGMKDKIFDVVIPTQEEIEVREGKRRTVERHIFPGYVLVNMSLSEESWYVVRNTPGVTGFVGMGNLPTALRPEEVSQIIKRMEAEAPTVKVSFKEGERVRIIDGPFNDFRGTVSEIDMERTKVRVMVSFFGRETPVELDFLQVEKA